MDKITTVLIYGFFILIYACFIGKFLEAVKQAAQDLLNCFKN